MATVVARMSMSLDGFVAGPNDEVDHVFTWHEAGSAPVETATADPGALICGRRLFELTNAWGGKHPMGAHVFVVTHRVPEGWPRAGAPFTFVTDGVASAVEQAVAHADGRDVAVATPSIARQCLDLGVLDGIAVDLVPVLLGEGIPFFAGLAHPPIELATPTVTEADGVTHLRYLVRH